MDELNDSRLKTFAKENKQPITKIEAKNYPASAKDKPDKEFSHIKNVLYLCKIFYALQIQTFFY